MKTIKIKLCGQCDVVLLKYAGEEEISTNLTPADVEQYDYIDELEELGFSEETDAAFYMSKYDRLTWEDVTNCSDDDYYSRELGVMYPNEQSITQLGDKIVTWSYIKDYIYRGDDRFAFQLADNVYGEFVFDIKLDDNEEFDPKKLQLIWAAHEIRVVDYGYVADRIMYNGKVYRHDTDCPEFDSYQYSGCYLYNEEDEDE